MKLLSVIKLLITVWNNTRKYNMKSFCLKCRKNTENISPRVSKKVMAERQYYQNVKYVTVKNRDFLNIKKQKDYSAI